MVTNCFGSRGIEFINFYIIYNIKLRIVLSELINKNKKIKTEILYLK